MKNILYEIIGSNSTGRYKLLKFRSCVTLGFAFIVQANSVPAQSWQTVDDFQYSLGQLAVNFGLTVTPSGVLFGSGYANDSSGISHGLVMASADSGASWSAPLDDFVYPGSTTRNDGGIVADSAGNLYVAGRYYFSSGPFYRYVRRSTDGGATWSIVDTVAISGLYASPLAAGAITADAFGNVYVTEPVYGAWTIRKGQGGTSFSTVDTFQPSSSQANAVFGHPTAGIFAVGFGTVVNKRSSSQAWVVRRSLDGGSTWSTVDAYQASTGSPANAYGIGSDGAGNIYVVGRAAVPLKNNNSQHWIVRKGVNAGTTWTTVDDYKLFSSGNQVALGVVADTSGNIYVAGWASASATGAPYYWVVRKSPGGSGTWSTVDNFPYISGAQPHAIASDSVGNIFVGGQGSPASGEAHWLARRN